ncbi:glycosyltransferase [Chimaeribacter coloradensis]|uniref:Glycosyltransferase n=1 Tax=Chimaeribacter coloradensis TaxID=2060068 RepID=A0A2N5EAP8_9GAMM|nr:ATP-grasp fold amidoligase family protein [Chimaeribacter coloradensis]PLR39216.1 glycosyltransferase [Chimaeribacter coloradensis]
MLRNLAKRIYRNLPDPIFHQLNYARVFKKQANITRPELFSEKILIRNIWPKKIYTLLADKIKVRDYISAVLGEQYLIPVYATTTEMTYELYKSLPNSFVMKANHGCGFNSIVFDKSKITYETLYEQASTWMDSNWYLSNKERHYQGIKPGLIFEELLQVDGQVPNDLKFHCFNKDGEMRIFIQVDYQRYGLHRRDVFDAEWNRTEIRMGLKNNPEPMPRPEKLDEMLVLAKTIASQFSYVRIDFYSVGSKIYFGELTFTPGAGLCRIWPRTVQREWGSYFTD